MNLADIDEIEWRPWRSRDAEGCFGRVWLNGTEIAVVYHYPNGTRARPIEYFNIYDAMKSPSREWLWLDLLEATCVVKHLLSNNPER